MNRIKNSWKNPIVQGLLVMIALCVIFAVAIVYALYLDERNDEGIQIINSPSFVGEVINKRIITLSSMTGLIRAPIYKMRIAGEYVSYDNEVIRFSRNLTVGAEFFNRYEIGDIISHH